MAGPTAEDSAALPTGATTSTPPLPGFDLPVRGIVKEEARDEVGTYSRLGQQASSSPPTTTTNNNENAKKGVEELPQEETFPQQLMKIIEKESGDGGSRRADGERVLEWLPSGEAFAIRDKKLFEAEILPKHSSVQCKFMSFVRKLYRWGFRQVEKNAPGVMIFMHGNFVRGEMQRCLLMRSIVKRHRTQEAYPGMVGQFPLGGAGGMLCSSFGLSAAQQRYGMDTGFMRDAFMPHPQSPQQTSQMMMYPSFNQGSDNNAMVNRTNFNGMGMGVGPSWSFGSGRFSTRSAMPGQFHQGGNDSRITSTDMFEAAMRLEMMEQQRQQSIQTTQPPPHPPMCMYDTGMNANSAAGLSSFGLQSLTAAPMNNANYEIELASKIMKRDPNLEPWKALELAKRFNTKS